MQLLARQEELQNSIRTAGDLSGREQLLIKHRLREIMFFLLLFFFWCTFFFFSFIVAIISRINGTGRKASARVGKDSPHSS